MNVNWKASALRPTLRALLCCRDVSGNARFCICLFCVGLAAMRKVECDVMSCSYQQWLVISYTSIFYTSIFNIFILLNEEPFSPSRSCNATRFLWSIAVSLRFLFCMSFDIFCSDVWACQLCEKLKCSVVFCHVLIRSLLWFNLDSLKNFSPSHSGRLCCCFVLWFVVLLSGKK